MAEKKKLAVEDLTISFWTNQGMVRAVRGVSFDLFEGETLAIVGESGSGKSVTSRAIMGILAGNAVIDKGHIYYEGQDLTKIPEDEFHRIRGDKIGMIFQDPMSSLNPIMRIGKQITEGMIINGKRLKQRYKRLVHQAKHDIWETKRQRKLLVAELQTKKRELKKAGKTEELADYKAEHKRKMEENDKKLQAAKVQFRKDKKEAKQTVKKEWNEKKKETKEELARLREELKKHSRSDQSYKNDRKYIELKEDIEKRRKEINELQKKRRTTAQSKIRIELRNEIDHLKEELKKPVEELKAIRRAGGVKRKELKRKISETKENKRRFKKVTRREARQRAIQVMREVGIPQPEKRLRQYPFQFSGGMRQRIVIAIALTASPDILICDEPTTALDVTIQSQILELIKNLKEERSLSVIFITHDLGVVANMADRIAVMYAGKIVEIGTADEIFYDPRHPYTWALLSSMPDLESTERLVAIPGTPPNMLFPPKGDAFAERNQYAMKIDFDEEPPFFKVSDTHYAKTWLLHKDAPEVEMPEILRHRIEKMMKLHEEAREVRKDASGSR